MQNILNIFDIDEINDFYKNKLENIAEIYGNLIQNREKLLHFDKILLFLTSENTLDALFRYSKVSEFLCFCENILISCIERK